MKLPELTETELEIMKVLWESGRLSAREIHEVLEPRYQWSYSTTRTMLERLAKKQCLDKKSFHGLFLYTPAITKAAGLARFVRNFASRILETDLAPVASLLVDSETLTPEELDDLTRLLEEEEVPS